MKEGAAPMAPMDETPFAVEKRSRKHRKKGDAPQRSSRRRIEGWNHPFWMIFHNQQL